MTYDGHARLLTRKLPVESSPTSFQYNADDLLHVRTDQRGATATFNYNARRLATTITYAKPGNAPEPDPSFPNAPAVAFGYDAAGNRLWMTDGQGRVDYEYNTWSRLTSETRFLQDLGSSFALTYQYNLEGELTRVTEPFGSAVNYVYDSAGQMTSATGSGPVSAPVYISQMGYRAWGAPKQVNYGNGKNLSLAYNTRLQVTSFNIPGLMGATLAYYADGRVHTAQASTERRFDRAYTYDHAGRMLTAVSGFEAGMGSTEFGPAIAQQKMGNAFFGKRSRYVAEPDAISTVGAAGTIDGLPKIFLGRGAFSRLKEVLAHELLHSGGYLRKSSGVNDLAYMEEGYDNVIETCVD